MSTATKSKNRVSQQTWKFTENVRIQGSAVVVGPKEAEGPLKDLFDRTYDDMYAGQDSWEKAEKKLMEDAITLAIKKANLKKNQIDQIIAGDLLNQNITVSFTAEKMQFPTLGMYGACSSSMLTLSTASALVNAGYSNYIVAACSSHNATAERQFRYPTEYGGQKPPHSQCTVTGAGAAIVGRGGNGPRITYSTVGKVIDMGITDPFAMGAAMAPAAVSTIATHFIDTGRSPSDYDLIVTGDLGTVGYAICKDMLAKEGYNVEGVYNDCGLMIYSPDQEVFAGASGCASSASVTYSYIMNQLQSGKLKKVLVCATGALLSPISTQQGNSIPCIAHAVAFEGGK
ncbi:stage V sporulation protein AD [Brevibacillus laterosporus]|uniref:stage V sporulation protein AD n=1 Tax=Brevibacillus laterosporus TaxID=1465 RepID=UPI0018CEC3A3|nr:stage V sporulation protein AD [Brevibacillus laterosporus]MBG9797504.1 stage V sporulation protein AD [Brevibacillus laterosporus]MCR8936146.1 stage V sporulation protein AD [Brevibacillus laterosporus]MCZ0838785.1 stage V sporulation protein AD [Brevibacillus laterosporus]MCZ0844815.1 stage V sporulation protein AD [Brevibacillus laterosporus]MED1913075.1 stage V sporulation protein AD [Brevibacillus laterosporus]